jgi:hypothetical protein
MIEGALKADGRIAAKNAVKIRAALRELADYKKLYLQYQETMPESSGNLARDRTRARAWAIMNVTQFRTEALASSLWRMWAEAYVLGTVAASEWLRITRELNKADDDVSVDWDNWKPGDRAATLMLQRPKAFQQILDSTNVTIRGLTRTSITDIGNSLAEAIELGLDASSAALLISRNVASPARALTIAITEQNRVISAATMERYKEAGLEKQEWAVSDPCDICAKNDRVIVPIGTSFPSGDTQPPAHPHCRCVLLPVIPGMEDSMGIDGTITTPTIDSDSAENFAPKPEYKPIPISEDFQYEANPGFEYKGALVTEAQDKALGAYRGNGLGSYQAINDYLRGVKLSVAKKPDQALTKIIKDRVTAIDQLMKIAPAAPNDFYSYRGLQGAYADSIYQLKPGQTFTDLGYSSTTINRTVAINAFTSKNDIILEVLNPTGAKGIMMKGYFNTDAYKEQEWLLPRGTTYEVLSKTEKDGITIIRVVTK